MNEEQFWYHLSESELTDREVDLFQHNLHWLVVSNAGTLSEEAWMKYADKLDFDQLIYNPSVPALVYNSLSKRVDWNALAEWHPLNDQFLLEIESFDFPSLHAFRAGTNRDQISRETWETLRQRNGETFQLFSYNTKEKWLRSHVLPLGIISDNASLWDEKDWGIISRFHPLTFDFVKQHVLDIHTRELEMWNKAHTLTEDEISEIRRIVSSLLHEKIEHGEVVEWEQINRQYLFDGVFTKRYEHELNKILPF